MDVREVGRQLQVTHMLEGSVNRSTDKVRVVARLIDVANGFHLWSETYYSTEKDLLSLQSDVARKVASALRIELRLAETKQLAKPPTHDPEAYDLYLRGRYLLNKRTADSIQKGRVLFEQAVARDPRFALGHAGIADSYILLGKAGAISPEAAATGAWSEVSTTLGIDENLAEGYISRAILLADFDWNWPAAEADFQKALALNSNSAIAHHWYARYLAQTGRFEEALKEDQRRRETRSFGGSHSDLQGENSFRRASLSGRNCYAASKQLISKEISARPSRFWRKPTSITNSIQRGSKLRKSTWNFRAGAAGRSWNWPTPTRLPGTRLSRTES